MGKTEDPNAMTPLEQLHHACRKGDLDTVCHLMVE